MGYWVVLFLAMKKKCMVPFIGWISLHFASFQFLSHLCWVSFCFLFVCFFLFKENNNLSHILTSSCLKVFVPLSSTSQRAGLS